MEFYPSIVFIIKRNYIFIGINIETCINQESFYFADSKLLNNFNSAIFENDSETAKKNEKISIYSYLCKDPKRLIRDLNLMERELNVIKNFIHGLYSGNEIYHKYKIISKEHDISNTNTLGEKRVEENASTIFNSFLKDFLINQKS